MSGNDNSKRSIGQIISDATDEELKDYHKESARNMTPDRLKAMAARTEKRKRRHMRELAGVAALFILVVVGGIMVFNTFTTDVDADKNAKEEIVTEDGVVIEDGGWGSSSEDNWVITDWAEVKIAKKTISDLLIPEYIPNSYDFQELNIEYLDGDNSLCTYVFKSKEKKDEIKINQFIQSSGLNYFEVNGEQTILSGEKGDIYIDNSGENKKATMQIDGSIIIDVWCNLNNNEIIEVMDGLE